MRAAGKLITPFYMAAYAVLRKLPNARLAVRKVYWGLQGASYNRMAAKHRVDPKKVFFESYGGRSYGCSPKALFEQMLADERFCDWHFVWSFKEGAEPSDEPSLERADLVRRGSAEYFEALAESGTIIVNTRLPEYVTPGKNQTYVQCWHGTPLKKLGYDVEHMESALNTAQELADRFGMDTKKWDYLISPSPYTTKHLCDAFGVPEKRRDQIVLELGYPRNDELARARGDQALQRATAEALGVPAGKKAVLYAPTWRDDSYQNGVGYTFDYLLDLKAMKKELGDEWVVLFRPHYYISNSFDFDAYEGFVIDASKGDINRLYIASDALVTDYSSVMFDYAVLRKPLYIFAPDLDHYSNDIRGFYFDIHEVPGPLCSTTVDLVNALCDYDMYFTTFSADIDEFANAFCPHDDGHAAERNIGVLF